MSALMRGKGGRERGRDGEEEGESEREIKREKGTEIERGADKIKG